MRTFIKAGFRFGQGFVFLSMASCAGVPQFEDVPPLELTNQTNPLGEETPDPDPSTSSADPNQNDTGNGNLIPGVGPIKIPSETPVSSASPTPSPSLSPAPTSSPSPSPGASSSPSPSPSPSASSSPSPSAACTESVYSGEIIPASTRGANIVFLIDDSASMDGEIAKVVGQIQKFINSINDATNSNYRIILIFNTNVDAPKRLSPYANPFAAQLTNPHVKYIEQRTWSKWADIAFFRAFAPLNYSQKFPLPIPVDRPYSGAAMQPSQCRGPGKFFRPRDYQSNFFNTPGCINALSTGISASSFLLPNIAVNVIAFSDDDLNIAFDRAQFDRLDPTKNAYPEITYLMMKDLLSPLGAMTPFIYHSVVGMNPGESGVELVGKAHMALSKKTKGGIHSITLSDYQPIFQDLQDSVIFAEKSIKLTCSIRKNIAPQILFNGVLLDSSHYTAAEGDSVIRFDPSAFEGLDPNSPVQVRVQY